MWTAANDGRGESPRNSDNAGWLPACYIAQQLGCQLLVTFAWRQKEGAAFPGVTGAAEVERAWSDVLRGVRVRMMQIPGRRQAALGLTIPDAAVVEREVRAALAEAGHGPERCASNAEK